MSRRPVPKEDCLVAQSPAECCCCLRSTDKWPIQLSCLNAELRLRLPVPSNTCRFHLFSITVGLFLPACAKCLYWTSACMHQFHSLGWLCRLRQLWWSWTFRLWRPWSFKFSSWECPSPSFWLKNPPWKHRGSWHMAGAQCLDAQTCPWTQAFYASRLSSTPSTPWFQIWVVFLLDWLPIKADEPSLPKAVWLFRRICFSFPASLGRSQIRKPVYATWTLQPPGW